VVQFASKNDTAPPKMSECDLQIFRWTKYYTITLITKYPSYVSNANPANVCNSYMCNQ